MDAVLEPGDVGEKTTIMEQLEPAGTPPLQLSVSEKPRFPAKLIVPTVSVDAPRLPRVRVCGGLVVWVNWLPKARLLGDRLTESCRRSRVLSGAARTRSSLPSPLKSPMPRF